MRQSVFRSAFTVAAAAMILAGVLGGQAYAVNNVLAKWDMESITAPGGTPTNSGNFQDDGGFGNFLSGNHAVATTWSTPAGNGSAKAFSVNTWTAGDYWEFTIADIAGGGSSSNYGLQFDQVSSTTGPRDWKVQYSTNGTTFTDLPGGSYSVQPNAAPAWANAGVVGPVGLDTYVFDLRSITGLNGNANAKLRLTMGAAAPAQLGSTFSGTGGTNRIDNVTVFYNFDPAPTAVPPVKQPFATPVLPIAGDVVVGLGSGRTSTTLELVRGPLPGTATRPAPLSPWTTQNFTRFVKFDNLGGTAHNVNGNLIGVDSGASSSAGGNIYSYATQGTQPLPAPQLLGTTNTASTAATRIGGLSVSPGNTKIALAGMDSGKVLIYDYTPGNGLGSGAALGNLRQSAAVLDTYANLAVFGPAANSTLGSQQGTAWLNDNTALAFSASGNLYEVAVTAGAATSTLKKTVTTSPVNQSSTSLAYNPAVSPYIYAMYSGFTTPTTKNTLFIFDPAAGAYTDLTGGGLDFSTSAPNTVRDIALDATGNLVLVTNAPVTTGNQVRLEYITAASLTSLSPNSSVDWFTDDIFQGQPGYAGLDIGFAPASVAGDYNNDGKVNAADYVLWRKSPGSYGGTPAGYNTWRSNFGTGGFGSGSGLDGASVPEPTSAVLFVLGLVAFCSRRRSA